MTYDAVVEQRLKDLSAAFGLGRVMLKAEDKAAIEAALGEIARLRGGIQRQTDNSWALMNTIIHTMGGEVEGGPVGPHNYLQRLRELVGDEEARCVAQMTLLRSLAAVEALAARYKAALEEIDARLKRVVARETALSDRDQEDVTAASIIAAAALAEEPKP